MTQPNQPPENAAQRRVRLLRETRRAEESINKTLLEHSETEQQARRNRINQEIEKFLPGVTEDENSPAGVYTPDPKYFVEDTSRVYRVNPDHFEPIARVYATNPGEVITGGSGHEDIPQWTTEDENEWQDRVELMRHGSKVEGTGEWAKSLSPEEVTYWSGYSHPEDHKDWVSGRTYPTNEAAHIVSSHGNFGDGRAERIQLFEGGVLPTVHDSHNAAAHIDVRNVTEWAKKHKEEVALTGSENTEWKERYNKVQKDIEDEDIVIPPNFIGDETLKTRYVERVKNAKNQNLANLQRIWNRGGEEPPTEEPPTRSTINRSRTQRRRRENPPRTTSNPGVVQSFMDRAHHGRGATTRNEAMSHYEGRPMTTGWLNQSDFEDRHVVGTSFGEQEITDTLYSYRTPIAWRTAEGTINVPTQSHSVTTSRHQNILHHRLHDAGYHSPQQIANSMLIRAYEQDRHRQTAGKAVPLKDYVQNHPVQEFMPDEERAHAVARDIADARYLKVVQQQKQNAADSAKRPRNSRKPFTRKQQLRLEDAGQLRLPFEGPMPDGERTWGEPNSVGNPRINTETYAQRNERIMRYPITLGYSARTMPSDEN